MTHCLTRRATKHMTHLNGRWRTIRITRKWLDKIGAPACPTDCDNMEDALIPILTVQLMAEAG